MSWVVYPVNLFPVCQHQLVYLAPSLPSVSSSGQSLPSVSASVGVYLAPSLPSVSAIIREHSVDENLQAVRGVHTVVCQNQ